MKSTKPLLPTKSEFPKSIRDFPVLGPNARLPNSQNITCMLTTLSVSFSLEVVLLDLYECSNDSEPSKEFGTCVK